MDDAQSLGDWLRRERVAAGLTQEELADRSGVSVRAISDLERGRTRRPYPRSIQLLAIALGLPESGVHPGPDISVPAAASLTALDRDGTRRVLDELTDAHLLIEHCPGRYTFHDLLRAYAIEQAGAHDSAAGRHTALRRVLDHYAHTSLTVRRVLRPDWPTFPLDPCAPGAVPEQPAGEEQALAWCRTEQTVLLAATVRAATLRAATVCAAATAAGGDLGGYAWRIAEALSHFFRQGAYRREWSESQRLALAAAERAGDLAGQAHAHRYLGDTAVGDGAYQQADEHLSAALALFERDGDRIWQGVICQDRGWAANRQGRSAEALTHNRRALEMFEAAGDRAGQAAALNSVGWSHAMLGNHQEALAYSLRALDLLAELGDLDGEAATLDTVGYAYHQLGRYSEALDHYERALALFRRIGERYGAADTLTHVGDTRQALGDAAAAREAWRRALDILDDLGHPDAEDVRAKLRDQA